MSVPPAAGPDHGGSWPPAHRNRSPHPHSASSPSSPLQYVNPTTGVEKRENRPVVCIGAARRQLIDKIRQDFATKKGTLDKAWCGAAGSAVGIVDQEGFRDLVLESIVGRKTAQAELRTGMLLNSLSTKDNFQKDDLFQAALLWRLVRFRGSQWQEWLDLHGDTRESLLRIMQHINGDTAKVHGHEVNEVLHYCEEIAAKEEYRRLALGFAIARWVLSNRTSTGLLRLKLIERLELEVSFGSGCVRFLLLLALFTCFTSTLHFSSPRGPCRGIRRNLVAMFELDDLESSSGTWSSVHAYLSQFSAHATSLAPLSNTYFTQGAELNLLMHPQTFDGPMRLQKMDFWLGTGFTIQAWISITPGTLMPTVGSPIFRRALASTGVGSDLSCLSWNFPPSLSFGAHDYGGTQANAVTGLMEEFVSARYDVFVNSSDSGNRTRWPEFRGMHMHTVVVNETNAKFYIDNGTLIATKKLHRPITDCDGAVSTLGSEGMTLAGVAYLPHAATQAEIEEIFRQGTLLGNIGYGIVASEVDPMQGLEALSVKVDSGSANIEAEHSEVLFEVTAAAEVVTSSVIHPDEGKEPYSSANVVPRVSEDPVLGAAAWRIIDRAVYLSPESDVGVEGNSLPPLGDEGFAISVWLRTTDAGGYVLSRAIPAWTGSEFVWKGYGDMCWFVYVGGGATELTFRSGSPGVDYGATLKLKDTAASEDERFNGKSYRHFFFQVNPSNATDPLLICVDGSCHGPYRTKSNSNGFPPVDCEGSSYLQKAYPNDAFRNEALNRSRIWVGQRPPGDWPYSGDLANLKVYNRTFTEADIWRLFMEDPDTDDPRQRPMRQTQGCKFPEESQDDTTFRDAFGHDCSWYHLSLTQGRSNCERNPTARAKCPWACLSNEMCWGSSVSREGVSMQIWDNQMEFRSKGSWGTTCVAKSTTAAKEAIVCGLGATNNVAGCNHLGIRNCAPVNCSAFEFDEARLIECLGDVVWMSLGDTPSPYRFLPCAEIVRTHEPACDWDDSELERVATSMNETGEWSLLFWVEPVYSTSCIQPQMRLVNGEGLTFSWLGGWREIELDPPGGTGCNTNTWLSHAVHGRKDRGYPFLESADVTVATRPRPGEKHLVVIGVTGETKVGLQYDASKNFDDVSQEGGPPPLPPDKSFLRVINVFGDVRVSTMVLSSRFPLPGDISRLSYRDASIQKLKRGASPPLQLQSVAKLERKALPFTEKTFLIAPPLISQKRRKASKCAWDFADQLVDSFYSMGINRQCAPPYDCEQYARSDVYQCAAGFEDEVFFGLQGQTFMGDNRYVEFLSTITDFPFVVRQRHLGAQPELMDTQSFLDTLTSSIVVSAVFFAPEIGITTKLSVSFEAEAGAIHAQYELQQYSALTGAALNSFRIVQYMALAMQCALCFFLLQHVRDLRHNFDQGLPITDQLLLLGLDVTVQISALVFFVVWRLERDSSGDTTRNNVGEFVKFDWFSSSAEYMSKKDTFCKMFEDLSDSIRYSEAIETFGMMVTIVIFLRTVMATSAHPRIALITSTFYYAASDMIHFAIVFLLVLFGFAVVGCWRFGGHRDDMRDVFAAMTTQLDAILGPPGALPVSGVDPNQVDYFVYSVLIHLVNFFFLINFFLAIVVNAFGKTVEALDVCDAEQDIFSDSWFQIKSFFQSVRWRWPRKMVVLRSLDRLVDNDITPETLVQVGFKSKESAEAFVSLYAGFDFLTQESAEPMKLESMRNDQLMLHTKLHSLLSGRRRLNAIVNEVQYRHPTPFLPDASKTPLSAELEAIQEIYIDSGSEMCATHAAPVAEGASERLAALEKHVELLRDELLAANRRAEEERERCFGAVTSVAEILKEVQELRLQADKFAAVRDEMPELCKADEGLQRHVPLVYAAARGLVPLSLARTGASSARATRPPVGSQPASDRVDSSPFGCVASGCLPVLPVASDTELRMYQL